MARYFKKGTTTTSGALTLVPKFAEASDEELNWNSIRDRVTRFLDRNLRRFFEVPFATTGVGDDEEATDVDIRELAEYLGAGLAQVIRYSEDGSPNEQLLADNFFWQEGLDILARIQSYETKLDPTSVTEKTLADDTGAEDQADSNTIDLRPIFSLGDDTVFAEDLVIEKTDTETSRINPEDASVI